MLKFIKKLILFPVWWILQIPFSFEENVEIGTLDQWVENATVIDIFWSLFIGSCIFSVIMVFVFLFIGAIV